MNNMKDKQTCSHVKDVDENISPKTTGCEECEKEGTEWVALRNRSWKWCYIHKSYS